MLPKKYLSGAEKRKKRKQEDQFVESQRDVLHKFFPVSNNAEVGQDQGQEHVAEVDANEGATEEHNLDVEADANDHTQAPGGDTLQPSDDTETANIDEQEDSVLTIFDPRTWENLGNSKKDILIKKRSVREMDLQFPCDPSGRRFSYAYYSRKLSNGEFVDRKWLVYSKYVDKNKSLLAYGGVRDWKQLSEKLKTYDNSMEHLTNMTKNQTIDDEMQREITKEKERWRQILVRIVSAMKFLAKQNLAFRGSNEKLYERNNGNFLATVEMIAEFDPIMQENIRCQVFLCYLDCTPDVSHEEQMILIVCCVNMSSTIPRVEEFFLKFLHVDDTSGLGFLMFCWMHFGLLI
uniref:Uncharacterized protein n=1 Tax=Setaria viridis TaxID=4556 RepID=A0A4U6V9I2_SETVI|nr:hypothetical protein SEVIR_3G092000v2 [Setaria viridis]